MTDRPSTATLIRGAGLSATPWKNGGGVTREVAAWPAGAGLDAFVWRVSIADVAQAGPFSRFAGIDRTLVLLSGAGMQLDERTGVSSLVSSVVSSDVSPAHAPAATHVLTQPLDLAHFAGEASIDARLVDGATRDFNLMVRRGAATGEVDVWRGEREARSRSLSGDAVLLFCAAGTVHVSLGDAPPHTLVADDTLRIDAPQALHCTLTGDGALLVVTLRYTS